MNADGGDIRRLTRDGTATEPAWSPTEERIAFRSQRDGDRAIFVIDVKSGAVTRLSAADAFDRDPAWSPDGRSIAYSSIIDGDEEIFIMDADGANARRLTNRPGEDSRPSWTPDGTSIVFNSTTRGIHDVISSVSVRDSAIRNLGEPKRLLEEYMDRNVASWGPAVSPTDGRIAFTSIRSGNAEIYVMDADGSNVTQVTSDSGMDDMPTWIRH